MTLPPLDARIASLEGSYHQVSDRLNSIDHRLDGFEQKMDGRFNAVDARLAAMDSKIESRYAATDARLTALDTKIDRLQWRMTALMVGGWITVMTSIFLHR